MKYVLVLLVCLLLGFNSKVSPKKTFIRVFKYEKELEVWSYNENTFNLIKKYSICGLSGGFGPKRYEGDLQVPEGIYEVTRLNPHSNYHKAIKINYPNKSDSILSSYPKKGGEIYFHGKCVSVGCIAIGDKAIDELYTIVSQSVNTSVHIYPVKYDIHVTYYLNSLKYQPDLYNFEKNLSDFYFFFEKNKKLPNVRIDSLGKYNFE
jgi:murein L,D-transpeptidase YafK